MLYAKEKKEILEVLAPNNPDTEVFGACRALCQEGKSEHALLVALFAKLPEPMVEELLTYVTSFACRFPLGPVRREKVTGSRNTNWSAGTCQVCGTEVGAGQGGIVHDSRGWKVVCASPHCHEHLDVDITLGQGPVREVFVPEGDEHFTITLAPRAPRFFEQKEFVRRRLRGTWNSHRQVWVVRRSALESEEVREQAQALGLRFEAPEETPLASQTHEEFEARRLAWLIELGRALATQCEKDIERVQVEYEDYIEKTLASQRRRSKAYPELEMTEEVRERVHEAALYMLEQCDGAMSRDDVGFSRADAMMARHLFRRFRQDDRIDRALERMLARYHRQLAATFPDLVGAQVELRV